MVKKQVKELFESATTAKATATDLRRLTKKLTGVFRDVQLDAKLATSINIGTRQWVFVMSKAAATQWEQLSKTPMVLGVLHYYVPAKEEAPPSRMLVATPGRGGAITLQMIDASGQLLWTGTAKLNAKKDLEFDMPITRPNADAVGVMAGRLTPKGDLTFTKSQLPRPIKKNAPKLVAEE